ncbi:hypothetical protein HDU86_005069 [Geranomyces michiganensis]|nr:hypothetical protein HDU86_005069 [Geranomyces michiganensis]
MPKSAKLSFKNDPVGLDKKKRRKHKTDATAASDGKVTKSSSSSASSHDGWVPITSIDDITGPTLILSSASEGGSVLVAPAAATKATFLPLSSTGGGALSTYAPTSTAEVFVATRLPDSAKISFRSAADRYLGVDQFGVVHCDKEARGRGEEWEAVLREDGVALQTGDGRFLRCGEDDAARADADCVGFREVFQVRVQAANKYKAKKAKQEKALDTEALELESIKKFHSWGGGRLVVSQEDSQDLRKAKQQGQLNEALLDRRAKLKSDKFCK